MDLKFSPFRNWVRNLWLENCDEHLDANLPKYSDEEYFQKFKWWLKREYKHQRQKNAIQ